MSILKRLFGGNKTNEPSQIDFSEFAELKKNDYGNFQELFEQNAGLSFEKQMIFADVIGSNDWYMDMGKGSISFGNLEFSIQIIGSLSFIDNSWMWGWANSQSGMPENLLIQSNKLKEIGLSKNIKELSEGHFYVEKGFEHKMGMVVCGLFNSKSYYCANYGKGTLVVTIDDHRIPKIDKNKLEKVTTYFPQLISGLDLNHKNAFINYLIDREFKLKVSERMIKGLRNNKIINSEFDNHNRLKSLEGKL